MSARAFAVAGLLVATACTRSPPPRPAAPVASPASSITSQCVAHAGSDKSDSKTHTRTCDFGAECIAHPGEPTPGDGFVGITCDGTGCACSVRLATSKDDVVLPRFTVDAPCDSVRRLLYEHCVGKPEAP